MANSLIKIGAKFDNLNEFENVMGDYVKSQGVTYWKRHSRTLQKYITKRNPQPMNEVMTRKLDIESEKIRYKELSLCCGYGGRIFISQGEGFRPNRE